MVVRSWVVPLAALAGITFAGALLRQEGLTAGNSQAQPKRWPTIGVLSGDPLKGLGLQPGDFHPPRASGKVRFVGRTRYLNNARAVVTHTIDDSSEFVPQALDAMDRYDVKATAFIDTRVKEAAALWPRLQQAIDRGHEIGSHSEHHLCQWPDTEEFCKNAYNDDEITGSRNDILARTHQPYVWSWAYPCGNCAQYTFVQEKLAAAGYLVARPYPDEARDGHLLPNLQTYAANPYDALYTGVVQKKGGIARHGRTDVAELNAKFDEVYQRGGIYNFLSHPQWLDYGPDRFYEKHLAHIGKRPDVWYVPMGPLYAYPTAATRTQVRTLGPQGETARFAVYNDLDPKIYTNSVTLEFSVPAGVKAAVRAGGKTLPEKAQGLTDRWDQEYFRREGNHFYVTVKPNTIIEFRTGS